MNDQMQLVEVLVCFWNFRNKMCTVQANVVFYL